MSLFKPTNIDPALYGIDPALYSNATIPRPAWPGSSLEAKLNAIIEADTIHVDYAITEEEYNEHCSDSAWRDTIKARIAQDIAMRIIQTIKFTQIRNPNDFTMHVKGALIAMNPDQLKEEFGIHIKTTPQK